MKGRQNEGFKMIEIITIPSIVVIGIMLLKSLAFAGSLATSIIAAPIINSTSNQSTLVSTQNGTIQGKYLEGFNQDAYLGVPFAQPPLGNLRFLPPQPYNSTWDDVKTFDQYGYACYATWGTDTANLEHSEDCLTLNIVKPHGYENQSLPVGIWIHGGGFQDGSSTRKAYNLSYIVDNSVAIGKPFIGVSINYRLNGFGFLTSDEISQKGFTNVGLRDQIQAIHWINENIEGFGGNPNHLVLWGESAGAISIGKLLSTKYLSNDYIKGAIMESGSNVFTNIKPGASGDNQQDFKTLVSYFDCDNAEDYIECLQDVDASKLQYVFNATNGVLKKSFAFPYIDGDVISKSSYEILDSGEDFIKAPILIGTSTDEGSAFSNHSLNTSQEVHDYLLQQFPNLNKASISRLIEMYPIDNPDTILPNDPTYNNTPIVYPPSYGAIAANSSCLSGDLTFLAGSKITAQLYAKHGVPVYKYRHNIPTLETSNQTFLGTTHYQEVVYVFDNPDHPTNPSDGSTFYPSPEAPKIANTISKLFASFISDLDPNVDQSLLKYPSPQWPDYKESTENIVFDLKGFHVEKDDVREEQFNYIESIISQLDA